VGRIWGGGALLLVAAFMLLGFLRADIEGSLITTGMAFLVSVVLPAAGGVALIASHRGAQRRLVSRRDQLRQQTLESEVLRLAARRDGKLTVVEVVTELAVSPDAAKESLDSLMMRELAEIEIADSGMLVYVFRDIRNLPGKADSKGILD
jgi:hypothetical protein